MNHHGGYIEQALRSTTVSTIEITMEPLGPARERRKGTMSAPSLMRAPHGYADASVKRICRELVPSKRLYGGVTKEITMPRTLISPRKADNRYVRRKKGKFTKQQVSVGRSLAADRRSKSKTVAKKGDGDRGDQKRRKTARKKR
jgi:hypothetical protein